MTKLLILLAIAGLVRADDDFEFLKPMSRICREAHHDQYGIVTEQNVWGVRILSLPVVGEVVVSYKETEYRITIEPGFPMQLFFRDAKRGDAVYVSHNGHTSKFAFESCDRVICGPIAGPPIK